MSKTLLANVDGWTPCMDAITQELGVMPSIVFGRMWRYCQGEYGVCSAAIETIANELQVSYNTVRTCINKLVKAGYLEDKDPGLRNRPHRYADTGKAGLVLSITSTPQILRSRSSKIEEPTPQNLAMKKEVKKEEDRGKESSPLHPALEVYRLNTQLHVAKTWREKVIDAVGSDPEDLKRWATLVSDWVGCGWNKANVKGMLDKYNGVPAAARMNGHNTKKTDPARPLPEGI